jgi:hypothetical protein
MRIIHLALCLGVLVATVVLVVVRHSQAPQTDNPLLIYLGIGFAVMAVAAAWFVPATMDTETRKRMAGGEGPTLSADPVVNWALLYQTRLIVRCALLEGAAFFQPIAYFVAGHPVSLVVAAVLFLLLVLQFPTVDRIRAWIDRQRDQVEQIRQDAIS